IINYVLILLRPVMYCLLPLLGWSLPGNYMLRKMERIDKAIVIYAHTSNWDFIICLCYRIIYPVAFRNLYSVVKPQLMEGNLKYLFESLNAISASRYEDKGTGFVGKTVARFKDLSQYFIFLS